MIYTNPVIMSIIPEFKAARKAQEKSSIIFGILCVVMVSAEAEIVV